MWRGHGGSFKEGQGLSQSPGAAPSDPVLPAQLQGDPPDTLREDVCADTGFLMKMDTQGFAPEELCVQVDGQNLTVTGERQLQLQHNDGSGGAFLVCHQVHQHVQLPPDLDPTAMTCNMSPSGQLCFHGPCRVPPANHPADDSVAQSPGLRRQGAKRVHH